MSTLKRVGSVVSVAVAVVSLGLSAHAASSIGGNGSWFSSIYRKAATAAPAASVMINGQSYLRNAQGQMVKVAGQPGLVSGGGVTMMPGNGQVSGGGVTMMPGNGQVSGGGVTMMPNGNF